jgi:hypothetical protein
MKAYARFTDGGVIFAASGAAASSSIGSSTIAAATAVTGTASISGNVLTATAVTAGTIVPGMILTGPSGVATGSQVVAQLPLIAGEVAGGVGRYALSIGSQSVPSDASLAGTNGVLTVASGVVTSGAIVAGVGVTTGTTVWGQLSPTTWVVSPSQAVGPVAMTVTSDVETKWVAQSSGLAGELVKISDHLLG